MRDALQTRGVNCRPHKPQFESCPPRGLNVAGHYANWAAPARCRPVKVLLAEQTAAEHRRNVARLEREMYQAQDLVKALKAGGQDYADAAQTARRIRAEYLRVSGAGETRTVEVDLGSEINPVKAV